jgi:hypothetical protein
MKNETFFAASLIPESLRANGRVESGKESPALAAPDDLNILRAIVEGTAGSTGEQYFQALVRHLTAAIGVPFAAISEFAGVNTRVRTLAFWAGGTDSREFRV